MKIEKVSITGGNQLFANRTKSTSSAIEEAVSNIKVLPENLRDGWISYFLECIDSEFGESKLIDIKKMIDQRLSNGMW